MKLSPRLTAFALSLLCLGLQRSWAADAVVRSIVFDATSHNVKIDASAPMHAALNTINLGGRQRVIIDLDNAELGVGLPQDAQLLRDLGTHIPGLRNLSTHQFGSAIHPMVRLVLDMDASAQKSYLRTSDGSEIQLVLAKTATTATTTQTRPAYGVSSNYCATHRCSPASMPNWTGGMNFNNANGPNQSVAVAHPVAINNSVPVASKPELQKSDINLEDLKRALVKANQRYEEQVSRNQELGNQLDALKSEQAGYKKKLTQVNQSSSQSQDVQDQLKAENLRLGKKSDDLGKEAEQLRTKLASEDAELGRLRQEISGLQQNRTSLEERKASSSASQKALESALAKVKESEQRVASLQAENTKLSQQLSEVSKSAASNTNAQVSPSSSPEINSMRKQMIVAQTSLNEAIKTINEQNKEVANLRSQIIDIKNSGEQPAVAGGDEAIQKQLQAKDASIGSLKKEVQTLKNAMSSVAKPATATAKQTVSSTELKAQAQQIKTQSLQLATQTQQLKMQTQQIASLQTELKSTKTLVAQKQKDAETARQEVERLSTLRPSTANGTEADGVALDLKAGTTLANAERHYQTAKTALDNKQMDQAITEFKQAVNAAPDVGRYAIDASAAFTENQQTAEGIEILTHYLTRNPSDRDGYTQLGKLYLLNDQPDAAAQAFHRAIPISTLNNYASALKKTNKLSDAESVFKLALILNPKDGDVLFNLANLYSASNKEAQAKDYYLKALAIRPDFAEAHYNIGLLFAKLGDKTQAVSHLEQFLKLTPNARNADTIRAYIEKLKV